VTTKAKLLWQMSVVEVDKEAELGDDEDEAAVAGVGGGGGQGD